MKINILNKKTPFFFGLTVFLFFFIFGIPTPIGTISPVFAVLIILTSLLNYKKYYSVVNKEIIYLFLFLLFDLTICILMPTIFGTYDYTILKAKIIIILYLFATYIVAKYITEKSYITDQTFFKLLLTIFAVQAIIVVTMLINPKISELIGSFTRSSTSSLRMIESYAASRGLGIADNVAFGFAIAMGLFLFLSFFAYRHKFIGLSFFIFLIFFGTVASISAGRSSMLGMIFGFGYLMLNFKSMRTIKILFISVALLSTVIFYLIKIDASLINSDTLKFFYNYGMEPIIKYLETGSLSTGSTDILHRMYFPLTEKQMLIGDGRYFNGDSYYMYTDAGYMRYALFYGCFFSVLLYLYFIYFIGKIAMKNKTYLGLVLLFIPFTFILHYKGETVFMSYLYTKLLFLVLFYFYLKKDSTKKS